MSSEYEFDRSRLILKEDTAVPFARVFRTWSYPKAMHQSAVRWLDPDDDIVAVDIDGVVRGYPVRAIAAHHIVHDRLANEDVLVTFCDVCHSAVAFRPVVGGRVHHFDVSGIYEGKMVMRDRESRSEWLHFTGECVLGALAGEQLPLLPTSMTTWEVFQQIHPRASVIVDSPSWWRRLIGRTQRSHARGAYMPGMFRRTMRAMDGRLADDEFGLGVVVGARSLTLGRAPAAAKFYPYRAIGARGLITDTLESTRLAVVSLGARAAVAFEAAVGGSPVELAPCPAGLRAQDGSVFDRGGRCLEGPLQGERLGNIVAIPSRWYGFAQSYPDATVWEGS